jgi:hypothetical protein
MSHLFHACTISSFLIWSSWLYLLNITNSEARRYVTFSSSLLSPFSVLEPHMLVTLFSDSLGLRSFLRVRAVVSYPYKTVHKIMTLYKMEVTDGYLHKSWMPAKHVIWEDHKVRCLAIRVTAAPNWTHSVLLCVTMEHYII